MYFDRTEYLILTSSLGFSGITGYNLSFVRNKPSSATQPISDVKIYHHTATMSSLTASSSQSSNRIALAPIRDSRLNINSPLSLKNKRSYTSSLVDVVGPSTPSDSLKRQKVLPAQSQTLRATKSVSFSDFRFGSTPPKSTGLSSKPLVTNSTNATAGLAATKLKLKLQLAFYKLQHKSNSINNNNKSGNEYIDATKSHTQTNTSFDSSDLFTKSTISPVDRKSHLPTPPKLTGYSSSANMNLQTKTKIVQNPSNHAKRSSYKYTKKPSLSAIAYDKNVSNFKNTQNLRLFSVKKGSQYHHDVSKVPLIPNDVTKNKTHAVRANSEIIPRTTVTSDGSMVRLPKPLMCKVNMESSNLRSLSNPVTLKSMSLPPINKILKTPMKNSSSTRNLVNAYLQNQNQNQSQVLTHCKHEDANQTILNTDETIDEDDDGPLRESTCNSIKVSKKDNNNILSSSPIRNSQNTFGTPNSFSVAKSLLQLGSGFYS